jgi:hypothetical protein
MRFKLHTLVDITETNARRGDEVFSVRQQQNFLTVLQTIGLRVNPSYTRSPVTSEAIPKSLNLGTEYKGKHTIWTFEFDIEYEDAINVDMMITDFEHVPVITNLKETAQFETASFITRFPTINNIFFELTDK